jgi:thiamine-phosphate diphosphorylase
MIALPRLYPILDSGSFADSDALIAAASELAVAGCVLIQYRNKSGNARGMLEQARELRKLFLSHPNVANDATLGWGTQRGMRGRFDSSSVSSRCHPEGPRFYQRAEGSRVGREHSRSAQDPSLRLNDGYARDDATEKETSKVRIDAMNDRADLCLAADFDGVHVGQDDLSPEAVRKIISSGDQGPERWLGVSTHNPEQLREADLTSADYLAIGPVFATSSKEKPDPVVGLEGVRRARALTRKPLVAIGGITRANAVSVIEAGADSVAVISDLIRDPGKSAEEFLRILR